MSLLNKLWCKPQILNKRQRHAVYKVALEYYSEIRLDGMCSPINKASCELYPKKTVSGYEANNWPELKLFKPRKAPLYWFYPDEVELRKIILMLCIEMTRPSRQGLQRKSFLQKRLESKARPAAPLKYKPFKYSIRVKKGKLTVRKLTK